MDTHTYVNAGTTTDTRGLTSVGVDYFSTRVDYTLIPSPETPIGISLTPLLDETPPKNRADKLTELI